MSYIGILTRLFFVGIIDQALLIFCIFSLFLLKYLMFCVQMSTSLSCPYLFVAYYDVVKTTYIELLHYYEGNIYKEKYNVTQKHLHIATITEQFI